MCGCPGELVALCREGLGWVGDSNKVKGLQHIRDACAERASLH